METQELQVPELLDAGPALEALMQLCHDGAPLTALRTVNRNMCSVAERVGRSRSIPKLPLVLMVTADDFVHQHRPEEPEFVVEFLPCGTSTCTYTVRQGEEEDEQRKVNVPAPLSADLLRKLGRLQHQHGCESHLWAFPKLQRRATLNLHMTPEEYAWSSMQVAMQCDPRASRRLLLLDAEEKVILKHTFLDPDFVLPPPGRGAFRLLDQKGIPADQTHRWLLHQLRDLCGSPNVIVDSCRFVLQPAAPVGLPVGLPAAGWGCSLLDANIFAD
mmetsp:Transcript_12119/g.22851  ORF Transcript_12119/g.22851 Transcript_12119/m.22851 type:complete len:273 (+) Transcript_12119:116-934(+)